MSYNIEYAVLCDTGLVRSKNQDNFWCMGEFLENENDGLAEPIAGTADAKGFPAFAVFDGMGGEQQGEVAAYLAARSFDIIYKEGDKSDIKQFLLDACTGMNKAICLHIEEQQLRYSGSTAAILMLGKKEIYVCNIGDSRVYQFNNGELTQISHDHSEISFTSRKPALTQSLGISEAEFVIAPYVAKGAYESGDKYLICSDGLTDMLTDEEISQTMSENNDVVECAEALLQKALESGGNDNITIILCEIRRRGLKLFD
jgi:protein phosphatase